MVDAGYRLLAADYVRTQAKQLRAQFDGIRDAEDMEFVHRARVASRRLGAAMQMFGECFKRKQIKRWKKAIRRIRSELSGARDKDVQIELLREVLGSLTEKSCFAGIARLLVEWEYQRECLQGAVIKAVDHLQRDGALKEMAKEAKRILSKTESRNFQAQSAESFGRAEQEILGHLDQLLVLQDCLSRPEDRQSHHAMRIAAKRLRYTIEILQPIYNGALEDVLDAIKQIQTLLGEVHDCDVWQEELDRFVKIQRDRIKAYHGHTGPFSRLNAGIEFFRQDRLRSRRQSFDELMRLWEELDNREVWIKLVSLVQASALPPGDADKKVNIEQSSGQTNDAGADHINTAGQPYGANNLDVSPALLEPYFHSPGKHPELPH